MFCNFRHTKLIQTEQQSSMINMVVKSVLLEQIQMAELLNMTSMAEKSGVIND